MDLSTVRMVVTDMDGTLLNPEHEVSEQFFELFHDLKGKGVRFVAASGRQYHSMADKLDRIREDILFIAENGALVRDRDKVLLTTPLPSGNLSEILGRSQAIGDAYPVFCTASNAYVRGGSDAFLKLLREYYSEFTVVDDLMEVSEDVLKVAIYHFTSSEQFIYPAFRDLEADLKVKVSGSNWVDVSHPHAHKGYALEQVMRNAGLGAHQTLVFGDYNNDLEMMELSDFSFAMANAHPNVLKAARYRTASNSDRGVERILEQLAAQL